MTFVNQLRKSNVQETEKSPERKEQEKKFALFISRSTSSLPKLLKKVIFLLIQEAIKKTKNLNESDYESALDGSHQYPHYSYNILREKNSALFKDLNRPHETQLLPSLAWSVGLRSYWLSEF